MNYLQFQEALRGFKIFSLIDIKKIFPGFDSRRLVEWQKKGYIKKVINRWYVFTDVQLEEKFIYWVANRIYAPSYISLESGLAYYGLIPEAAFTCTSVSTVKTNSFDTHLCTFSYRHLKPSLFFGYEVLDWQGFPIKMASPEKVILDYLYLNPQLKREEDWQGLRINHDNLHALMDLSKLQNFLILYKTKALDKRVGHFLTHLELC